MFKITTRALVWLAAGITFILLGYLTGVFSFGRLIPATTDMNPGLYSELAWHFPPQASFSGNYWLGQMLLPQDFQPMSLLAHLPYGIYFSLYYPLFAALSLLSCYLFLRELEFRRGVALFGGLVYAWQGDLFSTLMAGHFSTVTVWFFFALAAFFAVRTARRGDWFYAVCAGVCTGMMVTILPDRGALCSFVIAGIYCVEAWRERVNRSRWMKLLGQLAVVAAVAGGIAYPGIFATLSWTTIKAGPAGAETPQQKYDWATQWSYSPEDILNYAVPGALGWRNGSDTGPYWGRIGQSAEWKNGHKEMRNFCLSIFTLGTVAVIFACLGGLAVAPWKRSADWRSCLNGQWITYGRAAAGGALVCWLFALGKYAPFYIWFYRLPYMDTWRNPVKFLAPMSLLLVVLAACGATVAARVLEQESKSPVTRRRVKNALGKLVWIFGFLWVASFPAGLFLDYALKLNDYAPDEIALIFSTLHRALFVAVFLCAILAWAWRLLSRAAPERKKKFINPVIQRMWNAGMAPAHVGRTWLAVLGVATVLQMFWVHTHYVQLYAHQDFFRLNPLMKQLLPGNEHFRVTIDEADPVLQQQLGISFPFHGIESVDIPAASRIPDDYAQFFKVLKSNHVRLLHLAGVRYLVTSMDSLSVIQEDSRYKPYIGKISQYSIVSGRYAGVPTHAVTELLGSLPKVSLMNRVETFSEDETLLKRLIDPDWNFHQTLLLRDSDRANAQVAEGASSATEVSSPGAKLIHYDGRRIEVEVRTASPAYLIMNDRFDPAWKATINGAAAKIFPADFILRGVAVPAGVSRVVMTYGVPLTGYYIQLILLAAVAIWAAARGVRDIKRVSA